MVKKAGRQWFQRLSSNRTIRAGQAPRGTCLKNESTRKRGIVGEELRRLAARLAIEISDAADLTQMTSQMSCLVKAEQVRKTLTSPLAIRLGGAPANQLGRAALQ